MRIWMVGLLGWACFGLFACGRTAEHTPGLVAEGGAGALGGVGDEGGADDVTAGAGDGGTKPAFVNGGHDSGGTGFGTAGTAATSCKPGQRQCKAKQLYVCNDAGTEFGWLADCTKGVKDGFCDAELANPTCGERVCTPGDSFCRDAMLYSCSKQGQYVASVDLDLCPVDPGPPLICQEFELRCQDGLLQACNGQGTAWEAGSPCQAGSHCATPAGRGECVFDSCEPASQVCLGDQVGTCAADGMSLGSVALDCRAQGEVCSFAGVCSASVVDVLGPSATAPQSVLKDVELLVVDVHTDRTLTELAEHLALTTGGEIRWLVYGWMGTGYQLLLEDTTQVDAGDAVFASHALDFELKAGQRYIFGVSVAAKGSFYWQAVTESRQLSFGLVRGCKPYEGPDYHVLAGEIDTNDYETPLRITTALPP